MPESHAQDAVVKVGHSEAKFGQTLEIAKNLGIGGCMDAAVAGDRLYIVGRGKLHVLDITEPREPKLLGTLTNLGRPRQIEVRDDIAYVTAREDGLFIVDVSESARPRLLAHYNTIELATGIAVSGKVAFVACRTYGVELIDVTDPRNPLHLSTVRTGEAQSCVARDGILYVGVWGSKELVICDVKNPRKPNIISKTPLDGYGDGVCVRGKYCFVATGHHSRKMRKRDESDPAFGHGHGLEIFDVTRPDKPVFVSRIKTPRYFRIGMDMWDVIVSDDTAYLADTYNGLFVIDISDIGKPFFAGHRQLAYVKSRKAPSPVGGFAIGDGVIYAAGAWTDMHVIDAPMTKPLKPEPDTPPIIPPQVPTENDRFRVYKPDGQVWAVAFAGDVALVACGSAGLHAVELWPKITKLAEYATEGFAVDVKVRGDYVYVAESKGGLSIWKRDLGGTLEQVGRFRVRGQSIKQVVVPPRGKLALLDVGQASFYVLDVTDPANPKKVFKDIRHGLLYGYQIAEGLLDDRYACCFWHVTGFYWYDLYSGAAPVYSGDNFRVRVGANNGMAVLANGKDALVTTNHRAYVIVNRQERQPLEELPKYGVDGRKLSGKPSIHGNTLYVADRFWGRVSILDITTVEKPKFVEELNLEGNPCFVVEHNGLPVIPAGYQGLLVLRSTRRKTMSPGGRSS
ncbi:MAG: hypothetical protein KAI66_22615, partial [Lentisphaeria bacterium]|nr:hypothetical protein [Lentisphaeria bacterium]